MYGGARATVTTPVNIHWKTVFTFKPICNFNATLRDGHAVGLPVAAIPLERVTR
jgi:hypothetical protein